MPLDLNAKKEVVAQVREVISTTQSAVLAQYSGLTVEEMTNLRVQGREQDVHIQVVRNNLAKIAVAETGFECLQEKLQGPLVMMLSQEDPGSAARLFRDFSKKNDKFVLHAVALDGQLLENSQINSVADLPTRDQALGLLCQVLQAPITQFVRTLAEPAAQVTRAMDAVRAQKEE